MYNYSPARKGNVEDNYHGIRIADPYRWLEDAESSETQRWVEAQQQFTESYLSAQPQRQAIRDRLRAFADHVKFQAAFYRGGYYFSYRRDGLQNQPVLYRQKGLDGEPVSVLDPNTMSDDGTLAITTIRASRDGRQLAYSLTQSGSDQQVLRIRNLDTGQDYPEILKHRRFGEIAWKLDGSGLYYDRYPAPDSGEDIYQHNRLYWHALGTPQSADVLIFEQPDAP